MITITKSGIQISESKESIESLKEDFQRQHFIRLHGLLSVDLMEELYLEIEKARWEERVHEKIGVEVCLSDPGIVGLMNFLLNDRDLFQLLETITGIGPIRSFAGRAYRLIPGSGHYDSWHSDDGEHRLLALTLNLGKARYQGGVLQIRQRGVPNSSVDVPNTDFGNAVLFRIAPELEHRVTDVESSVPKTAFAGWFQSEPDFLEKITGGRP